MFRIDYQVEMYSLGDLRTVVAEPKLALRECNRLYHTRLRQWEFNERAPNVFDEDWDNLIILDACRYDAFEEVLPEYDLPGESGYTYSRGASTMEFLRANLTGQDLSDTVYVTATSMLYRMIVIREEIEHNLHAVVDVWEDAIDMGEWGVRPERMADRVLEVAEQYPEKRIVAHLIQPHIPFIGEYGRERFSDKNIWQLKRRGGLDATDEELWQAYMENLRVAMPSTEHLLRELPGRSVVTADHGQLIGERGFPIPFKEYGHPVGIYCDELVRVPWHVYQNGARKQITAGGAEPSSYDEKDRGELDEKATEHLKNLGYLQ
jgi:hypothetical protein